MAQDNSGNMGRDMRSKIGIFLGPAVAVLLQLFHPPASMVEAIGDDESARNAWLVLSLLSLMAIWWVTEAIPIPVTSLLPMVYLPLTGVQTIRDVSALYMHPIVVLLMGGFIVAKAIERWNLHTRIALNVVVRAGRQPNMLIGGFMLAAALLSMWISNTATSIMMMPIAISVAAAVVGRESLNSPFTYALLLGIAYACSIGGLGTPVGTPTNLIVMGYLNDNAGFDISFGQWMIIGIPAVLILVPTAWFVLTRWAFRVSIPPSEDGADVVKDALNKLGPISTPEWRTLSVFMVIATLWIFKKQLAGISLGSFAPFAGLTDSVTAILGVILCFLIPSGSKEKAGAILDWRTAETIPWGVLLLFGGGMALAGAITVTGLGNWIGGQLAGAAGLPIIVLILLITTVVIFTTEVTSNVATASALMPVIGAAAIAGNLDIELLAAPLALAASCAFMLPMATGPNAVVFATGKVSLPTMAKAGIRLNLLAIPAITIITYGLAALALR